MFGVWSYLKVVAVVIAIVAANLPADLGRVKQVTWDGSNTKAGHPPPRNPAFILCDFLALKKVLQTTAKDQFR